MNQQNNLSSIEEDEKRLEQAPNLPISSAPLKAAIHQIHSACKSYMDNFMLCKRANGNPQSCVDQNIQLTKCTFEAIRLIQEKCNETYTNYWKCLDSNNHLFWMCREEEVAFNNCTKQKCGMTKQLWLHSSYDEPVRGENDFVESIAPNYAKFVKKNKEYW